MRFVDSSSLFYFRVSESLVVCFSVSSFWIQAFRLRLLVSGFQHLIFLGFRSSLVSGARVFIIANGLLFVFQVFEHSRFWFTSVLVVFGFLDFGKLGFSNFGFRVFWLTAFYAFQFSDFKEFGRSRFQVY